MSDLLERIHQQQSAQTAALRSSNRWQMLQTAVLVQQSVALNAIHSQMDEVRRLNQSALAVQQEMLNRDQIQGYIEELIFQTGKVVNECNDPSTDIPPSAQYLLLLSLQEKVAEEGIATAVIRGRDNKAAFERVFADVQAIRNRLETVPEVQESIRWAREQEARTSAAEAERRKKLSHIESEISLLQSKRAAAMVTTPSPLFVAELVTQLQSHTNAFWGQLSKYTGTLRWVALGLCVPLGGPLIVTLVVMSIAGALSSIADHTKREHQERLQRTSVLDRQIEQLEHQRQLLLTKDVSVS